MVTEMPESWSSKNQWSQVAAKEISMGYRGKEVQIKQLKAVEQAAQRNCGFFILSKLNQIRPDQPDLTVKLTLV